MSFARYESLKDSGDQWLGMVPAHWTKTALKYLADYQNGYPFKPRDWGDGGRPIIRIAQLTGQSEPNRYAGELDSRVSVEDGDLLFSWSATLDSFYWRGEKAWLNQHIFKVSPTGEATKGYLFYLIKFWAEKLGEFDAHGSTMRHIKKESLGQRTYIPALAEQDQICKFLDRETTKIDDLLAAQSKLIELLAEKRQAVISTIVSRGLKRETKLRESGSDLIGLVPEGWPVGSLGYLATVTTGSTPDRGNPDYWNGDIPWVKTGEVAYETIMSSEEKITAAGLANSAAKISPPGTLLMAMYGQGVTRGRVATLGVAAAYNQACAAITFGPRVIHEYGRYFFIGAYDFFRDAGNESSQMNLGSGVIRKFKLPVPSLEEQWAIVGHLDAACKRIDQLIEQARMARELLKERRSMLIAEAITGKIDVRSKRDLESEEALHG